VSREIDHVLDQMQRSFVAKAWHGPAVLVALDGVTAPQAVARPIPTAHTILEIVRHMSVWKRFVRRRVSGEEPGDERSVAEDVDWAAGREDAGAWAEALDELRREQAALIAAAGALTSTDLDRVCNRSGHTVLHLLHGAVQHDLYHAGQIVILKKGS
jgi:uncharacterized damage-inducible protein DinB